MSNNDVDCDVISSNGIHSGKISTSDTDATDNLKSSDDMKKLEESNNNNYRIDFGVVLKDIGNLGRYQITLVLLAYWVTIPSGINQVASVFLAASPDYR